MDASFQHRRTVLAIGLLTLVGFLAIPLAAASGNSGDVKVHEEGEIGLPKNDPHVGCAFFIEGFNMDATSGTITFKVWPPSGDKSVVHATGAAETWSSDATDKHGNHHFLSGPYSLPAIGDHPQGTHYKVFVSDTKHDKMKVFWTKCTPPPCTVDCNPCTVDCNPCTVDCNPCTVDCNPCTVDCQPCTQDCTPPPCTVDCGPTPPTTEVPFFPSTTSLVLGTLGAIGSVFVAIARRR